MNLLYITFGNDPSIHLQASFSIYSFLAKSKAIHSVNIITDKPAFYKHLQPHLNIITVTEKELNDWKGAYQFFWRIKIKAIEKICQLYPHQSVVYLDTDTFLFNDISTLQSSLQSGTAFMHENEGFLSAKKSKTEKKMWQQIANKKFGNILMKPSDSIWNAGVVAIPNTQNGKDCELALAICDEMCAAGVTKRLIEQYALSLALKNTYNLEEAKGNIAHYWSTKEIWNKHLNNFFIQAYFGEWNYEKIIEAITHFDTSVLPTFQKIKNTNLRLKKMIDKIFPNQQVAYLRINK